MRGRYHAAQNAVTRRSAVRRRALALPCRGLLALDLSGGFLHNAGVSGRDPYRATFESHEDALLLLQNGRITDANESANRLLAGVGATLSGLELAALSPPVQPDGRSSIESLQQKLGAALADTPQRFRWVYLRPGGGVVHADVRLTKLDLPGDGDGDGPTLRALVREEDKEQRRLYALAVDMLGVAGLDGRFRELSPSWERTLGFTREELMSRPYADFIHPEDKARTLSDNDTFSTGARTLTYENRYLCKDGSYRWLEWNAMLALDEGLVYFVARDVTRRKTAEQSLRESEEKMRSLFEGIPQFVMLLDKNGRLLSMNRMLPGFTVETVLGRMIYELIPASHHDTVKQALAHVLETGKSRRYDLGSSASDGSPIWYTSYVSAMRTDGEVTGLLVVTENITERRRAEQARKESEARFQAAVEASLDSFMALSPERDAAGNVIDFVLTGLNARAATVLAMPRETLLGRRLRELLPGTDGEELLRRYLRVVQTGKAVEEEFLVSGVGSAHRTWTHHQIVPLHDGVAATMRDITDRKRLEEQLRQSIERLETYAEELEGKNQMLAQENEERERIASVLRQQQDAIRALSTPIIQAWDGVLALPIIGVLDSGRAAQIMEKLLAEIVRTRASFAVLDLTGVEEVDAPTLDHLLQVARAASLLGSCCLISGISPEIAQAMAALGSEANTFETFAELQDALRHALFVTGARLPRRRRRSS